MRSIIYEADGVVEYSGRVKYSASSAVLERFSFSTKEIFHSVMISLELGRLNGCVC